MTKTPENGIYKTLMVDGHLTDEVLLFAQRLINFAHDHAIERKLCPGCAIEAVRVMLNGLPEGLAEELHNPKRKPGRMVVCISDGDDIGEPQGRA